MRLRQRRGPWDDDEPPRRSLFRRVVMGFFTALGIFVFVLVLASFGVWLFGRPSEPRVAENAILTLDLTQPFTDGPSDGGVAGLFITERPVLRDVLDGIERAGDDSRVKGIYARIGEAGFGLAQLQELRDAISSFRAKGKRAIAFADSFGELESGTRSYYLASSFDEIWVQPMGLVGLVGLRAETPFFRGTLDKLGLVPRFEHREEYKSAANSLTETAMTAPQREETEALLHSVYDQIVHGIAAGRKLGEEDVRALIDQGPLLTKQALDSHLIDHIGYADEARGALRKALDNARPIGLRAYLDQAGRPHESGPTIALIYADGLITRGESSGGAFSAATTLGADSVVRAFHQALRDPKVKAILFRIDSPGGSVVASETIWRATMEAHNAKKPVIVSMGDVAGSGGYYIAAAADKIVAEPATLTGSIGVIAGKMLIAGLMEKIGATSDAVQIGTDTGIFSAIEDFTPEGKQRFDAVLDEIYAGFKAHVAEGRHFDEAQVEAIAKGRVWTGADAKKRGLVDALGGYDTALALTKEAAGIPAASDVTIKTFPPPSDTATRIARLLGGAPERNEGEAVLQALAALRPLAAQIDRLAQPAGLLLMPAMTLR